MRFQEGLGASLIYAALAKAASYAGNQETASKDSDLVAANFPDVEHLRLYSPAFVNPGTIPSGFTNNSAGPTDQATLESFLLNLARRNDWLNYHEPNFKSEEGRSIPYVLLSNDDTNATGIPREKIRIWLQGGVHGDEPAGDQGLLSLLGKFDANTTWALSVLDKVTILVLPRYNPDGVAYFQRELASGFDPNRDHAILQRDQTRNIKRLFNDFNPHIQLDAHEYTAGARIGQYIKAQDVQVSAVKNPNIHQEIRQLGEGLFINTIYDAVQSNGLRIAPYFTASTLGGVPVLQEPGSISQAGHNNGGLGQRVTFLAETRGIRLGDQHFQRRVAAASLVAELIVQIAVDNAKLVYDTIENARTKFITSNNSIVVVDKSRVTNTTIEFISAANGSLVQVPVLYNNNTPSDVVLSRGRPESYIFSKAFGDVAERLRDLGVQVEVLEDDFYDTVEALMVSNVTLASSRHEGIVHAAVTTKATTRKVRIPKGGFRVSTRQQNAAYAFVTLEPENIASFVTYNKVPLNSGDEYPIFRIY